MSPSCGIRDASGTVRASSRARLYGSGHLRWPRLPTATIKIARTPTPTSSTSGARITKRSNQLSERVLRCRAHHRLVQWSSIRCPQGLPKQPEPRSGIPRRDHNCRPRVLQQLLFDVCDKTRVRDGLCMCGYTDSDTAPD
ncbi:hypothetical protein EXIGLDRAFT_184139 [Exidia glandulosa HHB12029]|uniref:Uncharacterized protein n=1 Tax=Exidia glandulosa HHB12029 TaxID=1314781 RepID=A0A165F0L7_EXIGL|nr:hypothetical protein EXIGLDRAFT_184139 [Exidia glandulosa HHB12029]